MSGELRPAHSAGGEGHADRFGQHGVRDSEKIRISEKGQRVVGGGELEDVEFRAKAEAGAEFGDEPSEGLGKLPFVGCEDVAGGGQLLAEGKTIDGEAEVGGIHGM